MKNLEGKIDWLHREIEKRIKIDNEDGSYCFHSWIWAACPRRRGYSSRHRSPAQ
jgi:hypothetical protein